MQKRRPVMLVVLDGWGWREDAADNAIRQAKTPTFDRLWATGPRAFLRTSGRDVGLPPGQMGNSEVGHLNIGAGRVVMQDLPRIGDAIASGEIKKAPALIGLIAGAEEKRRHLPPDRAGLAGRRAFASGPCRGAGENPDRRRRSGARACHHRRPRYAAAIGRRRSQAARGRAPGLGAGRDRGRPLLRDGPRQALGARRQGLRGDGRGRGAALCRPAGGDRGRLFQKAVRRVRHPRRDRQLSRA